MHPKDAKGKANNLDPDQTAPFEAVWCGSALFAHICMSQMLEFLQYLIIFFSVYKRFLQLNQEEVSRNRDVKLSQDDILSLPELKVIPVLYLREWVHFRAWLFKTNDVVS